MRISFMFLDFSEIKRQGNKRDVLFIIHFGIFYHNSTFSRLLPLFHAIFRNFCYIFAYFLVVFVITYDEIIFQIFPLFGIFLIIFLTYCSSFVANFLLSFVIFNSSSYFSPFILLFLIILVIFTFFVLFIIFSPFLPQI